jgi:hypothetical protein
MKLCELHESAQSKGKQVLDFSDYLSSLEGLAPQHVADFKKVGTELFKLGFTYNSHQVEFYKMPDEGGVFEFTLPTLNFHPTRVGEYLPQSITNGEISSYYYNYVNGQKVQSKRRYLASVMSTNGMKYTIEKLVASAHPVST